MKTELHTSTRVRQPERRTDIAVRLVESPVHRATRLRQRRKQQKRENQVMAVFCAVVGFGMTLVGLYVNEHCALNVLERTASRFAVDNNRLQERISEIGTESGRLSVKMSVPSAEVLRGMGLEYSKSPDYLGQVSQEASR
jgi:hypothetical protein